MLKKQKTKLKEQWWRWAEKGKKTSNYTSSLLVRVQAHGPSGPVQLKMYLGEVPHEAAALFLALLQVSCASKECVLQECSWTGCV